MQVKGATKWYMVRRSKLVVPPLDEAAVASALASEADAVALDLAHAGGASRRAEARALLPELVRRFAAAGFDVLVWISADELAEDLEAAVRGDVSAVVAGLNTAAAVTTVDRALTAQEVRHGLTPFSTGLDLVLTAPAAVLDVQDLLAAAWRICSVNIDEEALAARLGIMLGSRVDQLLYGRGRVIVAASLFGIQSHGLGFVQGADPQAISPQERAAMALKFGHKGAFCYRAQDAPLLNAGFSFTRDEVDHAQRVKNALEEAIAQGLGAVALPGAGGAMIDIIMLTTSNGVLGWMGAVAEKEARRAPSAPREAAGVR